MTAKEEARLITLTVKELPEEFNNLVRKFGDDLAACCELLGEIENRGVFHEGMTHGITRRYKEISSGRLSSIAAVVFQENEKVLDKLTGMPVEIQNDIALGKLPVPETKQ